MTQESLRWKDLQQMKEVMNTNKNKILVLLAIMTVAAVFGGLALTTYAAENGDGNGFPTWLQGQMMHRPGAPGMAPEGRMWQGRHRFFEVSEEFKQNAIDIAEADTDVQDLLVDGYSVARVRPMLRARVEGNGDVETTADKAVVVLEKDTADRAFVHVDLTEARVTKIVILTQTVIDKS